MELQYDLTYDDHLALQSYLMHKLNLAQRTPLRLVATATIAAAFVLYAVSRPAGTSWPVLIARESLRQSLRPTALVEVIGNRSTATDRPLRRYVR